jgi:hypothetical protein
MKASRFLLASERLDNGQTPHFVGDTWIEDLKLDNASYLGSLIHEDLAIWLKLFATASAPSNDTAHVRPDRLR